MTEDVSHSWNFKCFRKSVPKVGTNTKCVFLIINHSLTPPPHLWLRTMMICCFSPPCGLGAWVGFVWPALLLCVPSVGVTPLSVSSWCLGWARQDSSFSSLVWYLDSLHCGLSLSSVLSSRVSLYGLSLQCDVLHFLAAWWFVSKGKSGCCQAWNWHVITSATFCGQSKLCGQPRFRDMFLLLDG